MTSVVFVCRANVCRSPMAAALLQQRLLAACIRAEVSSRGTAALSAPPDPATVQVMTARGIDVSGHRGRQLRAPDLAAADLVLTMSRDNLRDAVVLEPRAWARTFTFKELVRRARSHPPREYAEAVADWLVRISSDREHGHLLGSNDADDLADPTGRPEHAYEVTAELLTGLADELVACCWSGTAMTPRREELPIETRAASRWFS